LFKLFLIICVLIFNLNANSYSYNSEKYHEAKKQYAKVISYNNKSEEIKCLKQLIDYGTKLKKSVYRYKQELRRLNKNSKPSNLTKPKRIIRKSKYSIQTVKQIENTVVIVFNKKISKKDIKYSIKKNKNGYRYIFDLKGRFKDANPTRLSMHGIKKIQVVQYRFNTLRISFINKTKIKPIYIINNKKIIIKINIDKKQKILTKHTIKQYMSFENKIIVIDAGHGGRDAGAVGSQRKYEKTIVLNIGKYLYKILKRKGYNVYLTRNKDKFVSLRYRTKLANTKKANIFISIHANAARKSRIKKARGIETYFLSPAKSKRAKRVAAKENRGDIRSMERATKNTFLTVLNQGKITASNKMAIDIHRNMLYSLRQVYGKSAIRDGGVREGPFWVLVGAQMPSILIEVGYISHPKEGRRIYSKKYQKIIAKSISNGINSYFSKNQ